MMKRIITIVVVLGLTVLSIIVGRTIFISKVRQKADNALFLSGDYPTAIKYYNKLIWWNPDFPGLYYNRGDAYRFDKQYEKAIEDYKISLKLGISDSLQTILRIALTAKQQENLITEEQYLQKLLRQSKDRKGKENEFWAANYYLGQLAYKKKNYRQAINYYNAAHLVNPNKLNLYHRANSYYALGLIDSARRDFNTSIEFVKKDFVRKYPNSQLAICDTCGFPFGSKEYELLTESNAETFIQTFDRYADDKEIKDLNEQLKRIEKNNR